MPDFVVNQVEVLRVGLLQPLHEAEKRHTGALKQKMDVVGHQTVGIDRHFVPLTILRQALQVGLVVSVSEKSFLSLISTNDLNLSPLSRVKGLTPDFRMYGFTHQPV